MEGLLYKLSDFVFHVKPGSRFWPSDMHEPLFIGISLPLLNRYPWSLRGTPSLVGLERQLCEMQGKGQCDRRDILQQLLQTPGVLARVLKVWHVKCYECLAQGQFPMKKVVDEEGNV